MTNTPGLRPEDRADFESVLRLALGLIDIRSALLGEPTVRTSASLYAQALAAAEEITAAASDEYRDYLAVRGPAGVRVNAVSPGPVRTEGTSAMLGEHTAVLDRTNARGRAGDPSEIADIVSFLVGPASSYVNGSILFADGGELSALPG